jgi:PadR family transcriptional regulator PadR
LTGTLLCYIVYYMNERFFDNWSTQLRKGMLEFCILNAIRGTSLYGYDIVRTLREIDGLVISEGTIYPILSRLKRDRLLTTTLRESTEGPARKYYELTTDGQTMLDKMNAYWLVIKDGTNSMIKERKP